jgi:hypothetical protein
VTHLAPDDLGDRDPHERDAPLEEDVEGDGEADLRLAGIEVDLDLVEDGVVDARADHGPEHRDGHEDEDGPFFALGPRARVVVDGRVLDVHHGAGLRAHGLVEVAVQRVLGHVRVVRGDGLEGDDLGLEVLGEAALVRRGAHERAADMGVVAVCSVGHGGGAISDGAGDRALYSRRRWRRDGIE